MMMMMLYKEEGEKKESSAMKCILIISLVSLSLSTVQLRWVPTVSRSSVTAVLPALHFLV